MYKINTRGVFEWNGEQYVLVENDYYYHSGDIALAKSDGSPSSTTTVQKSDPWVGQQGYLTRGFAEAEKLLNQPGPGYFPGNTVVPYSPETNLALNMQTQRALQGSPIQHAANDQLTSTLKGDYLYGGQGFNAAVDAATRKALPVVQSAFEKSGRTGSGLAQAAVAEAIASPFAELYGQERQNQQRGMLFAPQVADMDYGDISKLAEVGANRESMQQEQIADQVARYNYEQNLQRNKVNDFLASIQGSYGGTSSSSGTATTPMYRNQASGLLGGALGGYSLASSLGFNPLLGAGAGLLSSFF